MFDFSLLFQVMAASLKVLEPLEEKVYFVDS